MSPILTNRQRFLGRRFPGRQHLTAHIFEGFATPRNAMARPLYTVYGFSTPLGDASWASSGATHARSRRWRRRWHLTDNAVRGPSPTLERDGMVRSAGSGLRGPGAGKPPMSDGARRWMWRWCSRGGDSADAGGGSWREPGGPSCRARRWRGPGQRTGRWLRLACCCRRARRAGRRDSELRPGGPRRSTPWGERHHWKKAEGGTIIRGPAAVAGVDGGAPPEICRVFEALLSQVVGVPVR